MTPRVRLTVALASAVGVAVLLGAAFLDLPAFGGARHPYRDQAVPASVAHHTANVVSAVNFDIRGFDTLGEELILLASVVGVATLLRRAEDERREEPRSAGRVLDATRAIGAIMVGVTLLLGIDVIAHGHITPGGGFQGGVVLATGMHLLYVAGSYPALRRLRPVPAFEAGEAVGALAFLGLGIAALVSSGVFLANLWPRGQFASLWSAGTVPLLNVAVGIEVASGVVALLARFLEQQHEMTEEGGDGGDKV